MTGKRGKTKSRKIRKTPSKQFGIKRINIDIATKSSILRRLSSGEKMAELCEEFGVHHSTVRKWKKDAKKFHEFSEQNCQLTRKRMRECLNPSVDEAVKKHVDSCHKKGIPITGPLIQEIALKLNAELGGDEKFVASDGWLSRWKMRNGPYIMPTENPESTSVPKEKPKTNSFDIITKSSVLERLNSGETIRDLCEEFEVHPSTIRKWRKDKQKILEFYEKNSHLNRKRMRESLNPRVDEAVKTYVDDCHKQGIAITGRCIQKMALKLNSEMGGDDKFLASDGWLSRWKLRNGPFVLTNDPQESTSATSERVEKPRTSIDIVTKSAILERLNSGEPIRDLCQEFEVHASTIRKWKKDTEKIFAYSEKNSHLNRKRMRECLNPRVDGAVKNYVNNCRKEGIAITGPMIQKMALKLNVELGGDDKFMASDGWLAGWKLRNGPLALTNEGEESTGVFQEKVEQSTTCVDTTKSSVLERLNSGETVGDLCDEFEAHAPTAMQEKDSLTIPESSEKNSPLSRKRKRESLDAHVDEALKTYIENCRKEEIPLSGSFIKKIAMKLNGKLGGDDTFVASDSWLSGWNLRHGPFVLTIESGESSSFSHERTEKERTRIDMITKSSVLERLRSGETMRDLCDEFGVHPSTIRKWRKDHQKIFEFSEQNSHLNRKTVRESLNPRVDRAVKFFMDHYHDEGVSITGPFIQEMALELNKKMGGDEKFMASNGWLAGWKQRHGITSFHDLKEKSSTHKPTMEEFRVKIEQFIENENELLSS